MLININCFSQKDYLKGTEFWLGFMENIGPSANDIAITSVNGSTGTIEIPLSGWSKTFIVPPNGGIEIALPKNLTNISGVGTFPSGVKITSVDSVYVYAINRTGGSDDASAIKPKVSLGTEYYISTWAEPSPRDDLPEYIIVATEDNTEIEITYPSSITKKITLNAGQLFQDQLKTDLSGTHIKVICNNEQASPIAVFSGTRSTSLGGVGARDHLFEQMLPFENWGTSFNLIPLPYANDYFCHIISSENGTVVNLNNDILQLNAGEFLEKNIIGPAYVNSNKPISIQIFKRGADFLTNTNKDGDPLMINISPDDQGVKDCLFYSFDINGSSFAYLQYVQILTETSNTGNIYLDGKAVSSWNTNPYNNLYSFAEVLLPQGSTAHKITSSNKTFIATPSAQLHARSYGYTIGFNASVKHLNFDIGYRSDTVNYNEFSDTICTCEEVYFKAYSPIDTATYSWDFGDGSISSSNPVNHVFSNGEFEISLKTNFELNCSAESNLKRKIFVKNCDIISSNLNTICVGDSVRLSFPNGEKYLWSNGDTNSFIYVKPIETTTYKLTINNGSLTICDSITVFVYPNPTIDIGDSISICSNAPYTINTTKNGSFLWSTGETTTSITVNKNGNYWLKFTDSNNCSSSDTMTLIVTEYSSLDGSTILVGYAGDTLMSSSFTDTICSCEPVYFSAENLRDSVNFLWQFSDRAYSNGSQINKSFSNGKYNVFVTTNHIDDCVGNTVSSFSFFVKNCDIFSSNLETICIGDSVLLSTYVGSEFLWSNGSNTPSIIVAPDTTTKYSVIIDKGLTPICDSITIPVHPQKKLEIQDSLSTCSGTPYLLSPILTGSYLWSTGESTQSIQLNDKGKYHVSYTDIYNCTQKDSTFLNVDTLPFWNLIDTLKLCQGTSVELIPNGNLEKIDSFLWSNQAVSKTINTNLAGEYWLEIKNGTCTARDTTKVFIIPKIETDLNAQLNKCAEENSFNVSQENAQYLWSTGDTTSVITVYESGTYHVSISNQCENFKDSVNVLVKCLYQLFVPNAFTPNSDGINDSFLTKGIGIEKFNMLIFDRWGELIFESDDINKGWNGQVKDFNKKAQIDVYVCLINVTDILNIAHRSVSHVSLIR